MNSTIDEVLTIVRDTRECVKFLGELGVDTIEFEPANQGTAAPASAGRASIMMPAFTESPDTEAAHQVATPFATQGQSAAPQELLFGDAPRMQTVFASPKESLEDVWRDIGDCTRCGLCEGRSQVVNTHGNGRARLMFVGEAPGADEDAQGKPFVGRAGQLLTKMIEAMGMKREEVIIGNVNRCRPPGNRQPTLEEAAICRPFLFREIAIVQPDVIVVMGNTALRNLLEVREGITRVRGEFRDFRGIKVMPTFHPAYLLRDPSKKKETWEDLKKVRDYLLSTSPKSS